jgi:hypothetical protein
MAEHVHLVGSNNEDNITALEWAKKNAEYVASRGSDPGSLFRRWSANLDNAVVAAFAKHMQDFLTITRIVDSLGLSKTHPDRGLKRGFGFSVLLRVALVENIHLKDIFGNAPGTRKFAIEAYIRVMINVKQWIDNSEELKTLTIAEFAYLYYAIATIEWRQGQESRSPARRKKLLEEAARKIGEYVKNDIREFEAHPSEKDYREIQRILADWFLPWCLVAHAASFRTSYGTLQD